MRALLWLALLLGPARALAEDNPVPTEPPVFAAVMVGAGIAFGSLTLGGLDLATTRDTQASRRAGVYTILYGFAVSPIASHLILGEWDRALLFGAVPFASALSATWLIETSPSLLISGGLGKRRVLTLCYSLGLLGAIVGLFDTMKGGERVRERRVAFAPLLGRDELGVVLGGWL